MNFTQDKNNNRKIGVMAVILLILTSIIVISYFLFQIRRIEYEIISSPVYALDGDMQDELEKLYISESFLYFSSADCKEDLQKKFPYCKVEAVTRVFPSTLKIKLSERYELFAIKTGENFAICDEEGEMLRISNDTFSNRNTRLILVENFEGQDKAFKVMIDALVGGGHIENKLQSNIIYSLDFADGNLKIKFSNGTSLTVENFKADAKIFEDIFIEFFKNLQKPTE